MDLKECERLHRKVWTKIAEILMGSKESCLRAGDLKRAAVVALELPLMRHRCACCEYVFTNFGELYWHNCKAHCPVDWATGTSGEMAGVPCESGIGSAYKRFRDDVTVENALAVAAMPFKQNTTAKDCFFGINDDKQEPTKPDPKLVFKPFDPATAKEGEYYFALESPHPDRIGLRVVDWKGNSEISEGNRSGALLLSISGIETKLQCGVNSWVLSQLGGGDYQERIKLV